MNVAMLQIEARVQRGDFLLDVKAQWPLTGVTALFGRSGCGKTTLLRIIAGLEKSGDAQVYFAGSAWQTEDQFIPVDKRRVGLVFQEASLLPHLSVTGNLLYGYRRTPEAQRRLHPDAVIKMLGLENFLDRRIDQLSGGQAQRVALGRALLSSPQLLLLDEPLAALDTQTKREIMPFLSRLAGESAVPIILITHSPEEVQRLADRVVFMRDGLIEEICDLQQAMAKPDSALFADEGPASVLQGELGRPDDRGFCAFGVPEARLYIQAADDVSEGSIRLRVLARDVSIALHNPTDISIQNHLKVTITSLHALSAGRTLVSTLLQDGQTLLIEITTWSSQQLGLVPEQAVYALIKSVALIR